MVPEGSDEGDDRVDALVWGLTYLMLSAPAPQKFMIQVTPSYKISDW